MDKIIKAFSADIKIAEDERAVVAKITTAACDREGEVVLPQGINSKEFEKNPVVFFGHNHGDIPIGKCVGIRREEKAIIAKTVFADRPADWPESKEWMPSVVYEMYRQGIMKGFSIGFSRIDGRAANDRDMKEYGEKTRRVTTKALLLEYSAVPIPMNQEALAIAVGKGIVSVETAKASFGFEPEVVEIRSEPIPEPERKVVAVKSKLVYFLPPAIPVSTTPNTTVSAVDEVMQKLRGHIYIVD